MSAINDEAKKSVEFQNIKKQTMNIVNEQSSYLNIEAIKNIVFGELKQIT